MTRGSGRRARPDTGGLRPRYAALAVAAALLLAAACGDRPPDPADRASTPGPSDAAASDPGEGRGTSQRVPGGGLAIPLSRVRVETPAGEEVLVRGSPGRVTVINFWATWCVPCLEEIPALVALEDSIGGRGGRVLGIALDSGSPEDVRAFARKHEMDYDLAMAGHGWAREHFDVFGLPVTLVVDRSDTIRHRLVGPHDLGQFLAATRPWLGRSGSTASSAPRTGTREPPRAEAEKGEAGRGGR